MRLARSTFFTRVVAGLLVLSMLPALVAEAGQAPGASLQGTYAEWIRAQLRVPADTGLKKALDTAAQEKASTFEGFLQAFLDAYEAERPDVPMARAFTDRDLTDDALISYLQRRFTEITGEAILPRLCSAVAATPHSLKASGSSAVVAAPAAAPPANQASSQAASGETVVITVHSLTSARSQGP